MVTHTVHKKIHHPQAHERRNGLGGKKTVLVMTSDEVFAMQVCRTVRLWRRQQ